MVSDERLYLMENREKLEKELGGRYIAIDKNKIVTIGKTIHEVYEAARKLNIRNPLVTYIPREGEEALLI